MNFPPPSDRQARLIWTALTGLALALIVVLIVALVWGVGKILNVLAPVLWPLAIAGVLAYLLDPLVDFLQKRGQPRQRAILTVFTLAFLVVALLAASVLPRVIREAGQFLGRLPVYAERLEQRFGGWVEHPPAPLRNLIEKMFRQEPTPAAVPIPDSAPEAKPATNSAPATDTKPAPDSAEKLDWAKLLKNEKVGSAAQWLADSLAQAVKWMLSQFSAVASLFGLLAGLALVPVYGFYLLLEKDVISRKWTDYLPVTAPDVKEELVFVLSSINNYLIAFFRGQVLVALCDGLLYGIGFLFIGLPYAVVLGVLAVPLTIIPYVGSFVVFSMAMLIAVVQFGDWLHPLLVVMVFAIVQTVEGFVIQPKIVGDRVGLHPLVIIIAVITGTTLLGGLLGGILAIPLAAALRVIMARYVWKPVDGKRTVKAGKA